MPQQALKALLAHDQLWATAATIVVFAGLLVDLGVVLLFGLKERSRRLETILTMLGTLIIALGVLGEWHFESRVASDGNNLQSVSDQQVARLNMESTRLQQQNLQMGERLTRARQTLAETETQLEIVREREGWRHLNLPKFVVSLKDKPKPVGITILFLRDDPETWNLANEIFEGLHEAQWPVTYPEPIPPSQSRLFSRFPLVESVGGNSSGGISVVTGDKVKIPFWEDKSAAGALIQAFSASLPGQISGGKVYSEQPLPTGWIRIVVDPRMDSAMLGWPQPKK